MVFNGGERTAAAAAVALDGVSWAPDGGWRKREEKRIFRDDDDDDDDDKSMWKNHFIFLSRAVSMVLFILQARVMGLGLTLLKEMQKNMYLFNVVEFDIIIKGFPKSSGIGSYSMFSPSERAVVVTWSFSHRCMQ